MTGYNHEQMDDRIHNQSKNFRSLWERYSRALRDLDVHVKEIIVQQVRAEAAERRVVELEELAELPDLLAERDNEAKCLGKTAENLAGRVAELEDTLKDWRNTGWARKRVTELEEALMLLLDGLDSNYDERCGLTNKEWEQRISEARRTLSTLDK